MFSKVRKKVTLVKNRFNKITASNIAFNKLIKLIQNSNLVQLLQKNLHEPDIFFFLYKSMSLMFPGERIQIN